MEEGVVLEAGGATGDREAGPTVTDDADPDEAPTPTPLRLLLCVGEA